MLQKKKSFQSSNSIFAQGPFFPIHPFPSVSIPACPRPPQTHTYVMILKCSLTTQLNSNRAKLGYLINFWTHREIRSCPARSRICIVGGRGGGNNYASKEKSLGRMGSFM